MCERAFLRAPSTLSTVSPSLFSRQSLRKIEKDREFDAFRDNIALSLSFFLCLRLVLVRRREGEGWSICWREFRAVYACARKKLGKNAGRSTTATLNVFAQKKRVMQDRATDVSFVRSF